MAGARGLEGSLNLENDLLCFITNDAVYAYNSSTSTINVENVTVE